MKFRRGTTAAGLPGLDVCCGSGVHVFTYTVPFCTDNGASSGPGSSLGALA